MWTKGTGAAAQDYAGLNHWKQGWVAFFRSCSPVGSMHGKTAFNYRPKGALSHKVSFEDLKVPEVLEST